MTEARRGFFPLVTGDEVNVRQAGAVAILARNDLSLGEGGGQMLACGNNMTVTNGGGWFLACGNRLTITNGGGAIAAGRHVDVRHGTVGVALGAQVTVGEGGRVLVGTREAAVIGLAAGLACALLSRLLRR